MATLGEIREEIGVFNKTINNYLIAFDINPNKLSLVEELNRYGDVRDYQKITEKFVELLRSLKDKLVEFEKDYYDWKSPIEISSKIGYDEKTVLSFLNRNKLKWISENLKNVEHDLISNKSSMRHISSYLIMKEIQLEDRNQRIEKCINR